MLYCSQTDKGVIVVEKEYFLTDKNPNRTVTDAGLRKWLMDRKAIIGVNLRVDPFLMIDDEEALWHRVNKQFYQGLAQQLVENEKVKVSTSDSAMGKGMSGRTIVLTEQDLLDLLKMFNVEVVKTMKGDIL